MFYHQGKYPLHCSKDIKTINNRPNIITYTDDSVAHSRKFRIHLVTKMSAILQRVSEIHLLFHKSNVGFYIDIYRSL